MNRLFCVMSALRCAGVVVLCGTAFCASEKTDTKIEPTGYTYSHRRWLAAKWGDPTGKALIDGESDRRAHRVIFKGPIHMDFVLPGRFRVERVVVHAFRGNQGYLLDAVQLLARQQGTYVQIAQDTTGYRGPIKSSIHVYEFNGLGAVTDAIRVRMLTPNHAGLREVEFYGSPAPTESKVSSAPPVPTTPGNALLAREGDLDGSGQQKVLLENRFVQLLIDPIRGGIVESVFHKPSRKQLTRTGSGSDKFPGGLLEDHNWDPYYSYAPFPYTTDLRIFPDRAVLVLRGRGRQEMYAFTEIEKTLTLHRDHASLDVSYEYKNEPSSMTEFVYSWWNHNIMAVFGENNTFFVPSAQGIRRFPWREDPDGRDRDDWVRKVSRGWAGVLGESGIGLAVSTELRRLNCFYTWQGKEMASLEWRLVRLAVPPGESVKTDVQFLFLDGLKELTGVGHGFAGCLAPKGEVAPNTDAKFEAALFSDRERSVDVVASVQRIANGETQVIGKASANLKAGRAQRWTWSAKLTPGTYRLLLAVKSGLVETTFERALIVGRPDVPYKQEANVERIVGVGASGRDPAELPRHDLSFEIETPHEKWAKPLSGGAIRAFVLVDVGEQREIVELAQRLDLEVETVKIRSRLAGADYRYRGDQSITSLADAQERMLGIVLKRTFDVYVICGMSWKHHFTDAIRGAVLQQIREGAGFVWIGPGGEEVVDAQGAPVLPVRGAAKRYWTTLRLPSATMQAVSPPESNLARIIPLAEQLALLAYSHEKSVGTVHMTANTTNPRRGEVPVLVTGSYAKARTTALTWDNVYNAGRPDVPGRLLPGFNRHRTIRQRDPAHRYWEDMYALLARVIVWTAGRDSSTKLVSATVKPTDPPQLHAVVARPPTGCTLRVSWQDEFGVEVSCSTVEVPPADMQDNRMPLVIPVPETVPVGPAHAYLFLRDQDDCALDWGAVAFQMTGAVRARIEQPQPVLAHGQVAEATAVLERQGDTPGLRFEILLTDGYGRELKRETVPVPPGDNRVVFAFPTEKALGGQLSAALTLRSPQRVHLKRTLTFGLTRILSARGPRLIAWDMTLGSKQKYLNALEARRMLDLGADAVLDGWHRTTNPGYREIIEGGVQYHPNNCLSLRSKNYQKNKAAYAKTGDKKHLVRKPCLDDPEDRAALLKTFREHCEAQLANGGALDYCLGDEMSLSHYADYFDFCFHPSTLGKFRDWLKGEYGTLAALNTEWDTHFQDWAAVEPMTYKEARKVENPAPWADFRTYMEISFSQFLALVQETLTELDPRSVISLSGTQSPVSGNGMDWWLMSRAVPLFHSYNTSNMGQARRSFSPWQSDEPWFAGYWAEDPVCEHRMWWCLFHNCSGVSAWYTPIFFYPDMTYTTSGRQIRDHWQELTNGIWQQVRALRIEKPKVAIHYSQASIHATFIKGRPKAVHNAWEGWLRSLEDVGVPYDFISYQQIEEGELATGGYRVLILPHSVALSDAELAAVSRFVRSGNSVIADVFPGRSNEHCRPIDRPALAQLFGARPGAVAPMGGSPGLHLANDALLPRLRAAEELQLAGGESGGSSVAGSLPVIIRKSTAKGEAVLLNFDLAFYITERRLGKESEQIWRELLLQLLKRTGVAPSVTVKLDGNTLPHVEVVRYLDDRGQPLLFGLLNGLLPGAKEQRVEITFAGVTTGTIYDVRTGTRIGSAPTVTTVLFPGEPKLYAVVPRPVEILQAPTIRARAGEKATIRFRFEGIDATQAVQYKTTDAAGNVRPEYGGVAIAETGKGQVLLPLAVNDPPGAWKIHLTHILTGAKTQLTLRVE